MKEEKVQRTVEGTSNVEGEADSRRIPQRSALLSTVEPFGLTETEVDAAERNTTKVLCKG